MWWSSDRNHGCRLQEIQVAGVRSLLMENERLRILILVDKGTEIVEFLDKATDTDYCWRSPLGLRCLGNLPHVPKGNQHLTDFYTGGWFEAMPNVGEACLYKGAEVPMYGETWYLPWDYLVARDDPECISVRFFVRLVKLPFFIEKTFTLHGGQPTLHVEETVCNEGNETLAYQWGLHPNIGAPFLDETCLMELSANEVVVLYSHPDSRLSEGAVGRWPNLVGKNGAVVDVSRMTAPETGVSEVLKLNWVKCGMASITKQGGRQGICLEWDMEAFPHLALWHVSNGDHGYPRYGRTYVLGMVICSNAVWGLEQEAMRFHVRTLKPKESTSAWWRVGLK